MEPNDLPIVCIPLELPDVFNAVHAGSNSSITDQKAR